MISIEDVAPAMTVITTRVVYVEDDQRQDYVYKFQLVYEGNDGHGTIRGTPGGGWTLYQAYVWKRLYK